MSTGEVVLLTAAADGLHVVGNPVAADLAAVVVIEQGYGFLVENSKSCVSASSSG